MPDFVDSHLNETFLFRLNVLLRFYTQPITACALEMSPPGQIKAGYKAERNLIAATAGYRHEASAAASFQSAARERNVLCTYQATQKLCHK